METDSIIANATGVSCLEIEEFEPVRFYTWMTEYKNDMLARTTPFDNSKLTAWTRDESQDTQRINFKDFIFAYAYYTTDAEIARHEKLVVTAFGRIQRTLNVHGKQQKVSATYSTKDEFERDKSLLTVLKNTC